MKSALMWCTVPLLATSMLMAQTAAKPKKAAPAKPARTTVTLQDVQELKNAIAAQQQQIQMLVQQMQSRDAALQQAQQQAQSAQQQLQQAQAAATDAQQKAALAETAANEQKDTVAKLNNDMTDVRTTLTNNAISTQDDQKRFSALENLVGRFRFNGDVRVRGESFFQNCVKCIDRNRGRIRLRFGVEGKLNEDFIGGFSLATGTLGDPTTTNETLTNFFDRKTIAVDKAYITYNPLAHKWFSATGGKFAYQWQRTAVTGDSDTNPEGFNVKASFDTKMPIVKNVTIQAINYLLNETSGGTDSYSLGGQASAKLQYGRWTATPSFLLLKWQNTSALLQAGAFAVGATTTGSSGTPPEGPFPVPGEGPGCAKGSGGPLPLPSFAPCAFAPNGMTNAVLFDASGKPRFWSGFFYADFILNNQVKTGIARLPFNAILEYEDNLDAAKHPLDPLGNVRTDLGSQSHAYLVDVSLGQTRNKNDVQFGYAWVRQEQDSVLASFAESDQRAPTNILQHRFYALWKVRANTVASFTWWHGRTLNPFLENAVVASGVTVNPGQTEPSLNRLQFDLIYTF